MCTYGESAIVKRCCDNRRLGDPAVGDGVLGTRTTPTDVAAAAMSVGRHLCLSCSTRAGMERKFGCGRLTVAIIRRRKLRANSPSSAAFHPGFEQPKNARAPLEAVRPPAAAALSSEVFHRVA